MIIHLLESKAFNKNAISIIVDGLIHMIKPKFNNSSELFDILPDNGNLYIEISHLPESPIVYISQNVN